jgi:hypothetical protein
VERLDATGGSTVVLLDRRLNRHEPDAAAASRARMGSSPTPAVRDDHAATLAIWSEVHSEKASFLVGEIGVLPSAES